MSLKTKGWLVLCLVGLAVAAGCARSPEARTARHLGRGDRYSAQQQYRAAVIEYMNALRLDGKNVHAMRGLGRAHFQLGEVGPAYPYLVRARDLDPDNPDVHLKLGTVYLLSRRRAQAGREAAAVLARDPRNLDGLLLSAAAADTPREVGAAIGRLDLALVGYSLYYPFRTAAGAWRKAAN